MSEDTEEDRLWQACYDARQRYFEEKVGPVPQDILKMLSMTGMWPGGGLFVIPAEKIGPRLSAYSTFGLSNPGMEDEDDDEEPGAVAGLGYELLVVAEPDQNWPLAIVQWAVHAEVEHGAGLLYTVEKYNGATVEEIDTGDDGSVDLLIAKARAPLPTGTDLPNGKMEVLVATVITREEMNWSRKHGRDALLQKLEEKGIGQISIPGRKSVVS